MAVVSDRTLNAVYCHMRNIGRIVDLRYCGFYLYQSGNFGLADSIRVLQGNDRKQYRVAIPERIANGENAAFQDLQNKEGDPKDAELFN